MSWAVALFICGFLGEMCFAESACGTIGHDLHPCCGLWVFEVEEGLGYCCYCESFKVECEFGLSGEFLGGLLPDVGCCEAMEGWVEHGWCELGMLLEIAELHFEQLFL